MITLFAQANTLTGAVEKGFVVDNGGPTKYGVTLPFLTDYWRHMGVFGTPTEADIRNLTRDTADAAYEALIWEPLKCGFMPAGVGYALFDAAVNSGIHQATVWFQQIVGVITDGKIGVKTIAAAQDANPIRTIKDLSKARSSLMLGMDNATEEKYEKGWHIRLIDVTANAILINLGKLKG